LPRPADTAPGTLIVNPTEADLEGFRRYKLPRESLKLLGAFRASLPGCLTAADTDLHLCAPVGFDTGAPLVYAKVGLPPPPVAAAHTPQRYKLHIGDGDGAIDIAIEETNHSGRLVYYDAEAKRKTPSINAGVFPYYSYQVFYDFAKNEIGLKKR
jgi:hypothetical protein